MEGLELRRLRDGDAIGPRGVAIAAGRLEARLHRGLPAQYRAACNRWLAGYIRPSEAPVSPACAASAWRPPTDGPKQAVRPIVVARKVWGGDRTAIGGWGCGRLWPRRHQLKQSSCIRARFGSPLINGGRVAARSGAEIAFRQPGSKQMVEAAKGEQAFRLNAGVWQPVEGARVGLAAPHLCDPDNQLSRALTGFVAHRPRGLPPAARIKQIAMLPRGGIQRVYSTPAPADAGPRIYPVWLAAVSDRRGIPAVEQAILSTGERTLRARQHHAHLEQKLRRVGHGLRRPDHRHRYPRPAVAPFRHGQHPRRQLPTQGTTQGRVGAGPRSRAQTFRGPGFRYAQNAPPGGAGLRYGRGLGKRSLRGSGWGIFRPAQWGNLNRR